MKLKPDLQVSVSAAQAIVDRVVPGQAVAKISKLHGGEIAAVNEIAFANSARAPVVLKLYPDEMISFSPALMASASLQSLRISAFLSGSTYRRHWMPTKWS